MMLFELGNIFNGGFAWMSKLLATYNDKDAMGAVMKR